MDVEGLGDELAAALEEQPRPEPAKAGSSKAPIVFLIVLLVLILGTASVIGAHFAGML